MPYPALPPAPPAAIAVAAPACEVEICGAAETPTLQTAASNSTVSPSLPERFEPDGPPTTVRELVEQAGESRAELLSGTTAINGLPNYPSDPQPEAPRPNSEPASIAPTDPPPKVPEVFAPDATERSPQPAAAAPPFPQPAVAVPIEQLERATAPVQPIAAEALTTPPGLSIEPEAAATAATARSTEPEANLMRLVDRAFGLNQLSQDFAPVEAFIIERSRQLAQAGGSSAPPATTPPATPATPPALPFPSPASPVQPVPSPMLPPAGPQELIIPDPSAAPTPTPGLPPLIQPSAPAAPTPTPMPTPTPAPGGVVPGQPLPPGTIGVIELSADRQEFDEQRRIFTAEGNVIMRFQGALLDTDRLQVNLNNRVAVAEGRVALTRGQQVLRGNRFVYNFVQGTGTVQQANGEIFIPTADVDLSSGLANDPTRGTVIGRPISDRIKLNQPLQVTQGPGGVSITVGSGGGTNLLGGVGQVGVVNRLRFVADQLDFYPEGWEAVNVQITNDPFSPAELILKADRATLTRLSPLRDEVRATRARLVFDQRFTLPIFLSRIVLDRSPRQAPIAQFGFDQKDRGGLFVERPFDIIRSPSVQFSLTPQIFLQRLFTGGEGDGTFAPSNFGVKGNLLVQFGPRTTLRGAAVLTSLDPSDFDKRARASLRLSQRIGTHTLTLESSYRDRLFNGSLGFQTVFSSLGAVLVSPVIQLGTTGISLSYQAGVQNVSARTDRLDLLPAGRTRGRVNLTRYQAAASLNKTFFLWRGTALPATAEQGLRYTPFPVQPYVSLSIGGTGVLSGYSNGDNQNLLVGSVQLAAQFGNFSRDFFDYTAFSVGYSQQARNGESPFFFDRAADNRVLSFGFSQQIFGPFRFSVQGAFNLDNNRRISVDYILEYSRRTYGIILRYNPELQIGSLNLRISDFNWSGGTQPFAGSEVVPVERGIVRFDQ